jgi:hypothetical protein
MSTYQEDAQDAECTYWIQEHAKRKRMLKLVERVIHLKRKNNG